MGYEYAVTHLAGLTEEEFLSLECPNARKVMEGKEILKVESKQHAWIYDLCRVISTSTPGRPHPRYIPVRALARGGMALLFLVFDQWLGAEVVLKVPLPLARHEKTPAADQGQEARGPAKILRGGAKLRDVAQRMFRRLEPPAKTKAAREEKQEFRDTVRSPKLSAAERAEAERQREEIRQTQYYARVYDSFVVQQQAHVRAGKIDPGRALGYVPKTHDFGHHPKCYYTQEYIAGEDYFDWVLRHNDAENFDLFLKLVRFVEKCFHEVRIWHCDLNPTNIKVCEGVPVVLDYGIVKSPVLSAKTIDGAQMGTWGYSSPRQLKDAKQRDWRDDIFSLGRILHVTLTRSLPALMVAAEEDEQGRQHVEPSVIAQFYPAEVLPEQYREIFQKTQELAYSGIAEFRADLEGTFFTEEKNLSCSSPCEELRETRRILRKLLEVIRNEI